MRKLFLFLCLFFSFKNYAQSSLKKDSVSIAGFIKEQNILKKNPKILVIEDKKWVDLMKSYSKSKEKIKEDRISDGLKKKSVAERFNYDDKTAEKEIISIINEGNNDSIKNLFADIVFNSIYDGSIEPDRRKIINLELKSLFFKCLKNPQIESQTAQMLCSMQIEGYEQPIKELLLSGQSSNEIQLFCALKYANYGDVIDYFFNSLLNNKKYTSVDVFKKNHLAYSLRESYFDNTNIDEATRKKLIIYCAALLKKFPVDSSLIQPHYGAPDWIPAGSLDYNNQFDLIAFLLSTGDAAVLPIIEDLKEVGFKDNLTFKFLNWKLGIDQRKETFNALLNDCKFYNYTVNELFLKGLLTENNDQNFVDVFAKIEKPLPSMHYVNEWSDCLRFGIETIFNPLEKKDFNRIVNKAVKDNSYKQKLIEAYNGHRQGNILTRLTGRENWRKGMPNSWMTPFDYYNLDSLALPKRVKKLCDLARTDLESKGYKVFTDGDFLNFGTEEPSYARDKLNTLKAQSHNELNDMSIFIDYNYIHKSSNYTSLESDKFELNCFIFLNDIACIAKINDSTNDSQLIFNDISEILLKKTGSSNRFLEVNLFNEKSSRYFIFGNPVIAKEILSKYNFTE
ncbi:hypothetical protein OD917_11545 [Flavobacterium sp. SH_e]|uniref:hypothetical protein n=1 Tax=Flavobacterium sp. SH_e TaxID=2983767 RepID=UPI0021E47E1F|nr:hypothetical protein [Flavobacterium sp. SH_e]MCV2485563.1 hypothetical protein [Flavobacterium sp. SH_e]